MIENNFRFFGKDNIYIYHHFDDDGYTSGAILVHKIKKLTDHYLDKQIIPYTVGYTSPLPDVDKITKKDIVFFTDYSFSNIETKKQFRELHERGVEIIWIDHHASSLKFIEEIKEKNENEWKDNPFDMNNIYHTTKFSATVLAWLYPEHMENDEEKIKEILDKAPIIVDYVDQWDRFDFKYQMVKPFHYGFMLQEWKKNILDEYWDSYLDASPYNNVGVCNTNEDILNGNIILEYEKCLIPGALNNAFVVDIDGYEVLAMNKPGGSSIFGPMNAREYFPVVMPYFFTGKEWKYSLFSCIKDPTEEGFFACNEFAERYGGGGHPSAAGFTLDKPFEFKIMCPLKSHPKYEQYLTLKEK